MTATPVSVYIISKNEESRIGAAIRSVIGWADDVVVVDSGSTDQTTTIAAALGARVLHRDWTGYGPQKRFAEDQCRHRWVLNLDADEEVSPELAEEIMAAVAAAPADQGAFRIRVTDMLPGEECPSWHAYSYHILRLYHRDFGRMSDHAYQDRVEMRGGRCDDLQGRIHHRSFISWSATLAKINFYTTQVAEQRFAAGPLRLQTLRLWTEFPLTFLKIWIGRRYLLRGSMGLAMSITVAYLNLMRLLKTQEVFTSQQASSVITAESQHGDSGSDRSAAA
ncbi:MAG: glycosyltransferase family 2 protein [Planctomycetaceae bacterium]